jgi:hypothetical protein
MTAVCPPKRGDAGSNKSCKEFDAAEKKQKQILGFHSVVTRACWRGPARARGKRLLGKSVVAGPLDALTSEAELGRLFSRSRLPVMAFHWHAPCKEPPLGAATAFPP